MAEEPVLLLVHGFPLDSRMWHHQVNGLSGFRVIAPDLDGHGVSPAGSPAHSVEDMARALAARLDSAAVAQVHLGGFSMGGYAALAFLRLFPDRVLSLALVDTRANADNQAGRQGRDAMIARIREAGSGVAAEAMLPKMFVEGGDQGRRRETEEWMLAQPAEALIADLTAMRERPDSTGMLGAIKVRTLVVVGDQDPITPPDVAEAMAAAIPGARLVTIKGAAHLSPVEQPDQVNSAFRDFLDQLNG
ncbi:MAG: alpha/beta fold hydrolase [Candidatus Dormibacteria bacterium]